MDIITKTRELGALLQKDERYERFLSASKDNENDAALNELISRLQLTQISYQHESEKEPVDNDKLGQLDMEFRDIYSQIMSNPHMQAYEAARIEIEKMMKYINDILTLCLQGENPETCEPTEPEHNCSGDCCSCGGCH